MGELSIYCGCNTKGQPFIQLLNNKQTIVQLTPAQATEFGLGLISAACEALTDAGAHQMVTESGRSVVDAAAFVKNLRVARSKFLDDVGPSIKQPISTAPTEPDQVPENLKEQCATALEDSAFQAAAETIDISKMRLHVRCRLMEHHSKDIHRMRVASYAALDCDVMMIDNEIMLVDKLKSHVADGRYFVSIRERGASGTERAEHNRGAEIICYKYAAV